MNFKIGTVPRWVLMLSGLAFYGLWLTIPAARNYAFWGTGVLGLWLGTAGAIPGADGKRDRNVIFLSLLLTVFAAWIGIKAGIQPPGRPDGGMPFQTRLMGLSSGALECALWLVAATFGWINGFTAGVTQKNRKSAMLCVLALPAVCILVLPWPAVAVAAFFVDALLYSAGPGAKIILAFCAGLPLLLNLLLIAVAGFRNHPGAQRRSWYILGTTVLISFGAWGIAEGWFQWDVRRLRRETPAPPIVLTPSEQRALEMFNRFNDAKKAYFESWKAADTPPPGLPSGVSGSLTQQFQLPPNLGSYKWLPARFPDGYRRPRASEEYIARALAADASPEGNAMFDALEKLLAGDLLIFPPTTNAVWGKTLAELRGLEQWPVGRAHLRHYTGDAAGTVHYLDLAFRVGEIWPGDRSLLGQSVRIAIDLTALEAIVALGPDGPEYVAFYRDCLRRGLARHYNQLSEPWFSAARADALLSVEPQNSRRLLCWFLNPLQLSAMAREIRSADQAQAQFAAVRQQVADGIPLAETPARNFSDIYRGLARAALFAEARLQTGLALKLYRSLHGDYPETLQQLVPELLPALPNDPDTGKPLPYRKIENYFELGGGSGPRPLRPIADY